MRVTLYECLGKAKGHESSLLGYDVTEIDEIEFDPSEMDAGEALVDAGYQKNWIESSGHWRAYSGDRVRWLAVVTSHPAKIAGENWSEAG